MSRATYVDFNLNQDEQSFRDEVCAFVRRELTPEVWRVHRDPSEQEGWSAAYTKYFRHRLGEQGYISIAWPSSYGGGGKSAIYQVLLAEELEYHHAPALDRSITYVPNALIQFGSNEQKAELLPRIRQGEVSWFVGYSEPSAGSDLASLETRAVEVGDHFEITGQKSFSSGAHVADLGWVAARTDVSAPKHHGISVFVVDMKAKGVHVTSHPTMAGWTHHAVYFDHVRVPRKMLVGQLNDGWRVIMGAIDIERAALATAGLVSSQLDRLIAHCLPRGKSRQMEDPLILDQLCGLAVEAEAAQLMSYWVASLQERGDCPQFETSLALLYKRETARLFDIAGLDIVGPRAALRKGSTQAPFDGDIEAEYRDHVYFSFAAGGFDITRNVIATRGLGLPRHPA